MRRPRRDPNENDTVRTSMKELIEYVARSLVDDPMEVRVSERGGRDEVHIDLEVAPEDMGRVIGRSGRVASAMRTLLRVAAVKGGVRATLDIR